MIASDLTLHTPIPTPIPAHPISCVESPHAAPIKHERFTRLHQSEHLRLSGPKLHVLRAEPRSFIQKIGGLKRRVFRRDRRQIQRQEKPDQWKRKLRFLERLEQRRRTRAGPQADLAEVEGLRVLQAAQRLEMARRRKNMGDFWKAVFVEGAALPIKCKEGMKRS